jgi:hypothetical protein
MARIYPAVSFSAIEVAGHIFPDELLMTNVF